MRPTLLVTTAFALFMVAGCAHQMIEGTQVPDTEENREVVAVLAELRDALETLDRDRILSLVSPRYFENNGTPDPSDDYGYEQLREEVLPKSLEVAEEMHVSFEVHDIVIEDQRAFADIRYSSRARLDLPSGSLWDTHREFNRVEFLRENGAWRIVAGL